jgi:hypothetical protein
MQHVLTSRPARHPVHNAILPHLTAPNKTLAEYRSKVAAYLNSTEFKQRWDALKTQVSRGGCLLRKLLRLCACWAQPGRSKGLLIFHTRAVADCQQVCARSAAQTSLCSRKQGVLHGGGLHDSFSQPLGLPLMLAA